MLMSHFHVHRAPSVCLRPETAAVEGQESTPSVTMLARRTSVLQSALCAVEVVTNRVTQA